MVIAQVLEHFPERENPGSRPFQFQLPGFIHPETGYYFQSPHNGFFSRQHGGIDVIKTSPGCLGAICSVMVWNTSSLPAEGFRYSQTLPR